MVSGAFQGMERIDGAQARDLNAAAGRRLDDLGRVPDVAHTSEGQQQPLLRPRHVRKGTLAANLPSPGLAYGRRMGVTRSDLGVHPASTAALPGHWECIQ